MGKWEVLGDNIYHLAILRSHIYVFTRFTVDKDDGAEGGGV